jgi:hypothetical protein
MIFWHNYNEDLIFMYIELRAELGMYKASIELSIIIWIFVDTDTCCCYVGSPLPY